MKQDVNSDVYCDLAIAAKSVVDKFWDEFADCANEFPDRIAIEVSMVKVANEIKKLADCNYQEALEAIKVVLMCGAKEYYSVYDEANERLVSHEYSSWREAISNFAFDMPSTKQVVFFLKE